jgi:four helix bundle protein
VTGDIVTRPNGNFKTLDRLDSYQVYNLACELFHDFWDASEISGKDYRGRELVRQQIRSLDSIRSNIEEGYGRGFGKEWPQHLRIARGEARESRGRFERCRHLLAPATISKRVAVLNQIIGGLTKTLQTAEAKRNLADAARSLLTRHASPLT